jgi:hypothetical protein
MKCAKVYWNDGRFSLLSLQELKDTILQEIAPINESFEGSQVLTIEIANILPSEFDSLRKSREDKKSE